MAFKKRNTVDSNVAARVMLEKVRREQQKRRAEAASINYQDWLFQACPELNWTFPHTEYIASKLDAVLRGEIKRLMILVPFQHGKSSVVTERFPAYVLERNPKTRVAVAAATADLAHNFSRKIRNLVKARSVIQLDNERQAVEQWLTTEGGGLKAVGAGGQIIGFPADLMIIDDPVKNYDEANSKTVRESVWNWYSVDLYSRQQKSTPIILIMCMTGDTPVLMSDGSQRALRTIKAGDTIATYNNGRLVITRVKTQTNCGLDSVFKIRTRNGKIVRANERHPFLVEEEGQFKWKKLRDLTIGQKIVTVKDSGANGEAKRVSLQDAKSLLALEDTVFRTTTKRFGPMDIGLLPPMQLLDAMQDLNIGTELHSQSMKLCSPNKMASVQSADCLLQKTYEYTGQAIYALTTTTPQTKSELYSATTAIWQWATLRQQLQLTQLRPTSDFTTDPIVEIRPDGVEEVFDLEVEGTGNFIANGVVSHNTHWNEDDLAGRLKEQDKDETDPNYKWTVVKLPAICEGDDPEDYPVKREIGEALCPQLHPIEQLLNFQKVLGRMFSAGYQQRPTPLEGDIWKTAWFHEDGDIDKPLRTVPKFPDHVKISQVWDTALEVNQRNDPTAMVEGCMGPDGRIYVAAMGNDKIEFPELVRQMQAHSMRANDAEILVEDKAAAKPARQQLKLKGVPVIEIPSGTKDKEVRSRSVSHYGEAGLIVLVMQPGNKNAELLDQVVLFPNGKHDDLHDAFVYLLMRVTGRSEGWSKDVLKKLLDSINR
jgi:predicted phage terminase large subunit-like protein